MAATQPLHRHVVIDGRNDRTVSDRCDASKRLAGMDGRPLPLQTISAMPEPTSYWTDETPADELPGSIHDQAAVFIHAVRPCGQDRMVGLAQLRQVLACPGDVGLGAASVICSNLMPRRPKLRIAFSHGGGTLGPLPPRPEEDRRDFPALQDAITASPTEPTLQHLTGLFGETQIMVGADDPANFHEPHPVERIEAAVTDEATRRLPLRDNAATVLGRNAERSS